MIQENIGTLLYYARNVDNKLLVSLNVIAAQQASSNEDTVASIKYLPDYVATYPNDGIIYRSSNMVLETHDDDGFQN